MSKSSCVRSQYQVSWASAKVHGAAQRDFRPFMYSATILKLKAHKLRTFLTVADYTFLANIEVSGSQGQDSFLLLSHNMTVAARAIADRKTLGQRIKKNLASGSKVKCCWNSRLALKRKKPVDGEAMRLQEN
ncbi:hypothetical protein [Ruegeria arenilitoris]|uniref:hypothetical protein n=1 Tax=Ruegeria arenilitoris TaxID=1173585 RepID=UPI00147D3BB4|nr:hypothetical protein [Ruegeria arenilitoris]